MQPLLIPASATITLALAFYTIGVFWERRSGRLQPRHLAFYLLLRPMPHGPVRHRATWPPRLTEASAPAFRLRRLLACRSPD